MIQMAETIIDYTNPNSGDIREMILETVIDAHNEAVAAVIEYKEQGDVDELQDEILGKVEAVAPTKEQQIAYAERKAALDADPDTEIADPFTLGNYKFLANKAKEQYEKAMENLKTGAYEEAKAGINADYDIDKGRATIKDLRGVFSKAYSAAFEMLKMTKSIAEETTTDEDGKTTTEFVAQDKFGELLLKASAVPSIRAKRGTGESTPANSEGAKIRAWGKENGWPELNDRGPLPTDLKEAYAKRNEAEIADEAIAE
jgi:hypothetical protein